MFEITIKETTTTVQKTKEYQKVGEKEVDREHRYYSDSSTEPKTRLDPIYDYVEVELPVNSQREVLCQTVEDLDLVRVIKAINGIE